MKERVQELAKEASKWYLANATEFSSPAEWNEKFAELIVRECADIANRQFSAATGLDDRDCLTAHQMKQHFGVTE